MIDVERDVEMRQIAGEHQWTEAVAPLEPTRRTARPRAVRLQHVILSPERPGGLEVEQAIDAPRFQPADEPAGVRMFEGGELQPLFVVRRLSSHHELAWTCSSHYR